MRLQATVAGPEPAQQLYCVTPARHETSQKQQDYLRSLQSQAELAKQSEIGQANSPSWSLPLLGQASANGQTLCRSTQAIECGAKNTCTQRAAPGLLADAPTGLLGQDWTSAL